MAKDNKAKIGIIAAIGAVISLLAVVFYKLFPKMKEYCQGKMGKCCGQESGKSCCKD